LPRGGARPGSGPKKKSIPQSSAVTLEARRRSSILYEALTREARPDDSYEIQLWRSYTVRDSGVLWRLFEHSEGRAVHTVNHLHDKPLEMNVNVSIAEVVRKVRERKEQYERNR
jgi:hypothetical protein